MAEGESGLPGSKCRLEQSIIRLKVTKFGEIVNKDFGYGNGVADLSLGMNPADLLMNINRSPAMHR
jgi:hypothetical protein